MATIDRTGYTPTTLSEYLALLRQVYIEAFGEDLSFDPDTPQAQITAAEALINTQLEEVFSDLTASLDIDQAQGVQLDNLASILSIIRKGAINANVNAEMTGVPLSVIPSGAQAKLDTGEIFELQSDVSLDGSGNGSGFFSAVDTGVIAVPSSSLNTIVTPQAGWETVTNSQPGATGQDVEKDFEFKRRYFLQLAINAITPIDAIIANVFALDGVTDVTGFENDEPTPQVIEEVTIPPHSIAIVVSGGDDSEVASTIRTKKTLGTGTDGDITVPVPVYLVNTNTLIQTLDVKFYRVQDVPTIISLDITTDSDFPPNGEQEIKDNLVSYFNGSDPFTGDFELDGLMIAEDVVKTRLFTPINRTPGHVVNELNLLKKTYPVWDSGTTYDAGDIVEGSDTKIYQSDAGGNLNNDPTSTSGFWTEIKSVDILNIILNEQASITADDITITTS